MVVAMTEISASSEVLHSACTRMLSHSWAPQPPLCLFLLLPAVTNDPKHPKTIEPYSPKSPNVQEAQQHPQGPHARACSHILGFFSLPSASSSSFLL